MENLPTDQPGISQCEDFMQFQNALRDLRLIDDKIVQALNTTLPTASFKALIDPTENCHKLYQDVRVQGLFITGHLVTGHLITMDN